MTTTVELSLPAPASFDRDGSAVLSYAQLLALSKPEVAAVKAADPDLYERSLAHALEAPELRA